MSNIEHLIENALVCIKNKDDFETYKNAQHNKVMLRLVNAPAEEIWEIANYVYYVYQAGIINDTIKLAEESYGYPIPT